MDKDSTEQVWIGLLGLTGPPENQYFEASPGAYVTVLARASDQAVFRARAAQGARELGLEVKEVLWSEPLQGRLRRYDIEEYLLSLADEVRETGELRFGVFHAWEAED